MIIKKWTFVISWLFILIFLLNHNLYSSSTEIYSLSNGMNVILEPDKSSPMISFCTIVKFGARNESSDMFGAAHFIEHLIFNGTSSRTQEQLYKEVDLIGGYNNASTDRAATTYLMLVPYEYTELGLELQADMIFNSIFPVEKFEKEKGIILEEIGQQSNDSYSLAENYFDNKIMTSSGYSHPILGSKESVLGISRDKLYNLYQDYYKPSNIILKVNGNFESSKIKIMIEKYLGKALVSKVPDQSELKALSYDYSLYTLKAKPIQINYYSFALPAPGAKSEDAPVFFFLANILNNRLNKLLKPNFPIPIMRISADYLPLEKSGYLKITIMTPPMGDPATVTSALFHYIENYAFIGLDDAAIRMMISGFKTSEIIAAEKPHITTFVNGPLLAVGGADFLNNISNTIPWLSPDDIQKAKDKYFSPLKFSGIYAGPGPENDPIEGKLVITKKMIEDASNFIRKDKVTSSAPIPIIQSQAMPSVTEPKMIETVLNNGMRIGVIQSPDSQVFAAHLLIRNRSVLEPQGKSGIAVLLNSLLMSGTGQTDAAGIGQIADAMGLTLTVNDNPMIPFDDIYTQPMFSFIRLETSNGYWKPSLSFLYNILYHSTFPTEEFEKKKSEQLSLINKNAFSPSAKAKTEFFQLMFGGEHPLSIVPSGTAESVASITKDDLSSFRNKYFAPDNIIITVSTDQPAEAIIAELNRLFGEEKTSLLPQEVKAHSFIEQQNKGSYEFSIGKKQSSIIHGFLIPYEKERMYALLLANNIISDKLSFQLREKEGLAYSLGSNIEFYRHNALFYFSIGTSPDNISKAIEGIKRELSAMEDYEISQEEITKSARMFIGRLKMRTLSRINQAYYAGIGLFFYRDINYLNSLIEGISKVNIEETVAAIKTIASGSNSLTVIAK